jgi:hypothetical protein
MRRGAGQRGSALLIVFVFAAVIAILLYREMPVAVFEAHRQKEELLIDRGNEYKHAIKLFVRKVGTFPPSIEALENTNRMRFLRHKFDDPFTGKADWRMLHAGPGGMIIDSKVNTNKSGVDANGKPVAGNASNSGSNSNTGFGSSSGFGSNSNSSMNAGGSLGANSAFGQGSTFGQASTFGQPSRGFGSNSDNNSDTPEVTVAAAPQRAPAIAANGSASAVLNNDFPIIRGENGQPTGQPTGQLTGQPGESLPVNGAQSPEGAVAPANAAPAGAGNSAQDSQTLMRSMLNSPSNPQTPQRQQPAGRMGTIMSGGIAGVASKASGHSIKLVNDQDNYSLWEFYYDMAKEANAALSAAQGASRIGNTMVNGTPTNPSANTFGSSNGFSLSNSNSNSMAAPGSPPAMGPMGNPPTAPNQ